MLYLKSYLGLLKFTRFSIPFQIFILKIFHFIDLAHMAVCSPSARHHSRPKIRKKLPRFLEAISNSDMLYLKSYLGLLTFTRFSIPSQIFILKIFYFINLAHMAVHSPSARHHSRTKSATQ